MYMELQLSAQDVTELRRKHNLRAAHVSSSRSSTPPTSQTFASAPGSSSSQFSPPRPRPHVNSKDSNSLSESTAHTVTCDDRFCPSHSSPGRAVPSVCPHHSRSQQSGCSGSSSSAEEPMQAAATRKVSLGSSLIKANSYDTTLSNHLCVIVFLNQGRCSDVDTDGTDQADRSRH